MMPNGRLKTLCFLVVLTVLSSRGTCDELQVGVGRRVITPDPLLPVSGGMGPTAPTTGKRGELNARAVVLRSGDTTVACVPLQLGSGTAQAVR